MICESKSGPGAGNPPPLSCHHTNLKKKKKKKKIQYVNVGSFSIGVSPTPPPYTPSKSWFPLHSPRSRPPRHLVIVGWWSVLPKTMGKSAIFKV